MIVGYDTPPFDPADCPDPETLERACAKVFPVPLPGVNKAHERTLISTILALRTTARRHGSPPEFVWVVADSLIFKGLNETFQKMLSTDEERQQWEDIKRRLKQLVEEPYGDE